MENYDIQMVNGIFSGEKNDELTKFIINKFAQERLNRDEAMEVLKNVENVIGEYAMIQHTDQNFFCSISCNAQEILRSSFPAVESLVVSIETPAFKSTVILS